ncbi:hypothetical protein PhCBS80983_g04159 [Powellomyces hirtus]|uniref:RanBP2-type domain-containing protein n=1 Tax=Powellomyces hirtus TaxID=109895 RepID=A0A507E1K9_9FUNG|nr:hypothetical protein PhCBS80983_g04159 [Powellomyces hirtus]
MAPPLKKHQPGEGVGEDSEELGAEAAKKYNGLFSEKDWKCKLCSNINWARRSTCNQCQSPKPGSGNDAHREGFGGGFFDREAEVEYRDTRFRDDDEYDDFGRKKKKKRKESQDAAHGSAAVAATISPAGRRDSELEPENASRNSTSSTAPPTAASVGGGDDGDDDDDDEDDGKWDAWADVLGDAKPQEESSSTTEAAMDNQRPGGMSGHVVPLTESTHERERRAHRSPSREHHSRERDKWRHESNRSAPEHHHGRRDTSQHHRDSRSRSRSRSPASHHPHHRPPSRDPHKLSGYDSSRKYSDHRGSDAGRSTSREQYHSNRHDHHHRDRRRSRSPSRDRYRRR